MGVMFVPASVELSGGLTIGAPVEHVFGLFSPDGEKLWVPGWAPELLYPPQCRWERGLIFRTQEEQGEAVWVVTALEPSRHEVEYYRVEPGRYVARVHVGCQAMGTEQTEVAVTYTFVGLSEVGNREIAVMSKAGYEEKMSRWQGWISTYLSKSRT